MGEVVLVGEAAPVEEASLVEEVLVEAALEGTAPIDLEAIVTVRVRLHLSPQ